MKKKTRRKDSDEFKGEAVRLVKDQRCKTTEAARNRGIHQGMLKRWIKQRSPEAVDSSTNTTKLEKFLYLGNTRSFTPINQSFFP